MSSAIETIISSVIKNKTWHDDESIAKKIVEELSQYGFIIVYQSKCWCEGKNTSSEHTPGCAGIEQEQQLHQLMSGGMYCWSRGPRIGSEGTAYCKLEPGHDGPHKPAKEDGWGLIEWGKPDMITKPK